jgi:hypothetical protein
MPRPARERERPLPVESLPEVQTAVLEPVMYTQEQAAAERPPAIAPAPLPRERYLPEANSDERQAEPVAAAPLPQERYLAEANTDERQAEPVAAAPARQPWKMEPIALPPDMEMVETQADKAARMIEKEQQDFARAARPPRQRNSEPVIADEPLQQVETREARKE